jgi:hypothetical protein
VEARRPKTAARVEVRMLTSIEPELCAMYEVVIVVRWRSRVKN